MAKLVSTTKQPYEAYFIFGNFEDNMVDGETITSATTTAMDKAGTDATADVLESGSQQLPVNEPFRVYIRVQAGTVDLTPYKFTIRCLTSTGNKWEVDGTIIVKET